MRVWQARLKKLVEFGTALPEPYRDAYRAEPPSGQPWPGGLPSCPALLDFYATCDGGAMGPSNECFSFSKIEELAPDTRSLAEWIGEDEDEGHVLIPGRWLAFGSLDSGAALIWDAAKDVVVAYDSDGGGWYGTPSDELNFLGRPIQGFFEALFFPPQEASDGEMTWSEALDRVGRL